MEISFYKYQGAGNDFILIKDLNNEIYLTTKQINFLCDRHFGIGSDGLILLQSDKKSDFYMKYYNSDGNESTMCGNGGRCIVRFASDLKLINEKTTFFAIDGLHHANVNDETIQLQMIDVEEVNLFNEDYVLNTGSPHYIQFVSNLKDFNVFESGKNIRYSEKFKSEGINVNFVEEIEPNYLFVRTYERGVEDETLACGTGITAATLAYASKNNLDFNTIKIKSLGGNLNVSFEKAANSFKNIWLEGEAKFVFSGEISI